MLGTHANGRAQCPAIVASANKRETAGWPAARSRLVRGEAVEQAAAAGAAQVVEAAAAVGAARGMRRIPRSRRNVVAQALAVGVTQHGSALGAARPVAAGAILARRKRGAVHLRAGQNVMRVG